MLIDREATEQANRRLTARLRQRATIEDVDYRVPRGLDRSLFQRLIAGDWITAVQKLTIEGPTGVGESWLACALANKVCRDNYAVLYQRIPRLFPELALARGDGVETGDDSWRFKSRDDDLPESRARAASATLTGSVDASATTKPRRAKGSILDADQGAKLNAD